MSEEPLVCDLPQGPSTRNSSQNLARQLLIMLHFVAVAVLSYSQRPSWDCLSNASC